MQNSLIARTLAVVTLVVAPSNARFGVHDDSVARSASSGLGDGIAASGNRDIDSVVLGVSGLGDVVVLREVPNDPKAILMAIDAKASLQRLSPVLGGQPEPRLLQAMYSVAGTQEQMWVRTLIAIHILQSSEDLALEDVLIISSIPRDADGTLPTSANADTVLDLVAAARIGQSTEKATVGDVRTYLIASGTRVSEQLLREILVRDDGLRDHLAAAIAADELLMVAARPLAMAIAAVLNAMSPDVASDHDRVVLADDDVRQKLISRLDALSGADDVFVQCLIVTHTRSVERAAAAMSKIVNEFDRLVRRSEMSDWDGISAARRAAMAMAEVATRQPGLLETAVDKAGESLHEASRQYLSQLLNESQSHISP